MSALRRLWSRAPLWRLTLLGAVAMTAMAALYPPRIGAGQGAPRLTASFKPLTPADVINHDASRDVFALAGRIFPLPPGEWHRIEGTTSAKEDPPYEYVSLVRLDGSKATGIVFLGSTTAPATSSRTFKGGYFDLDRNYAVASFPPHDAVVNEFAAVGKPFPREAMLAQSPQPLVVSATYRRMLEGSIEAPPLLVSAAWLQTTDRTWEDAVYYFAPAEADVAELSAWTPGNSRPRGLEQLRAWLEDVRPLLESGASGRLSAEQVRDRKAPSALPAMPSVPVLQPSSAR